MMSWRAPTAQLAAFLPQGTGTEQGQHDGQYEAPKVPMVEQEQIQYMVRGRGWCPGGTWRGVQVATALGAAFLRWQAAMATLAETCSHLWGREKKKHDKLTSWGAVRDGIG